MVALLDRRLHRCGVPSIVKAAVEQWHAAINTLLGHCAFSRIWAKFGRLAC